MPAILPSRRTVLVTLSLSQVGDRVVISGAQPDMATVSLAGALRRAGIAAQLYATTGPRTVRGLARGLAARDPETILVRVADDALLELAGIWIVALRTECPEACIVLLSDSVHDGRLGVDAHLAVEDHAGVLELMDRSGLAWGRDRGHRRGPVGTDRAPARAGGGPERGLVGAPGDQ